MFRIRRAPDRGLARPTRPATHHRRLRATGAVSALVALLLVLSGAETIAPASAWAGHGDKTTRSTTASRWSWLPWQWFTPAPAPAPSPRKSPRPRPKHSSAPVRPGTQPTITPSSPPSATPSAPATTTAPTPTATAGANDPAPTTPVPRPTTRPAPAPTAAPAPTTPAPPPPTTNPPPSVTGCAARPSSCGYPDATNTGVPSGTVLRSVPDEVTSGPGWRWTGSYIQVTGDGAVVDGITTEREISVEADNVTIRNSKIVDGGDGWAIALRHANNATIEHNELAGRAQAGASRLMVGIKDIYGDSSGTRILANNIYYTATGVQMDQGLLQDNYIHDLGFKSGDHVNGFTSNSGTEQLTVRHNTILNPESQTDAISLFQDSGTQANRLVDDNLIAGGGYALYAGAGSRASSNIVITNNRFARIYYSKSGYYGPATAFERGGAGNVWSGNIWDDTGATVNAP